jgi:hypothetical protein
MCIDYGANTFRIIYIQLPLSDDVYFQRRQEISKLHPFLSTGKKEKNSDFLQAISSYIPISCLML